MTKRSLSRRRFVETGAAMATGVAVGRPRVGEAGGITHLDSLAIGNQGTVELQVYVHANHPFDEVKPLFEAAHPDIKLNMLEQNDMAALRATLAANGEGAPDIFWPEINDVQILGASQALLTVTDLVDALREDLVPGKVAECFIPSTREYAAFPGDIATVGLYYRADLWEKVGVSIPDDWSWEEFLAAATTVKEQTGAFSLFFPPDDGTGSAVLLFDFVLCQLGGAYTNADGTEVTMDDEKGVAALTLVKTMYEADVHIQDSPTNETFFAALAGNQVATLPMPVWYRGYGIEPNVTEDTDGYGQWRVALLPTPAPEAVRTANYGGAAIASTKYTKYPEQVKAFMEFALGSMEGAAACGEWGILPPYVPYLESPSWTEARSPVFGDFAYNEVWTAAVAQYPGSWYKQAVFGEARITLASEFQSILQDDADVAERLKAVGDRVRELNGRYQ